MSAHLYSGFTGKVRWFAKRFGWSEIFLLPLRKLASPFVRSFLRRRDLAIWVTEKAPPPRFWGYSRRGDPPGGGGWGVPHPLGITPAVTSEFPPLELLPRRAQNGQGGVPPCHELLPRRAKIGLWGYPVFLQSAPPYSIYTAFKKACCTLALER